MANFRFLILFTKLYYVSTFLLSWQRYAYGIQDADTVKRNIDLRMKQLEAIMRGSSEVFPSVLRSKRFISKANNFLQKNPSMWHCRNCADSNPKNPFLHPAIDMTGDEEEKATAEDEKNSSAAAGFPELSMEAHNVPLGLNESELIKLLSKDEIVHLVEDYYNSQAFALIAVSSPSQKVVSEADLEQSTASSSPAVIEVMPSRKDPAPYVEIQEVEVIPEVQKEEDLSSIEEVALSIEPVASSVVVSNPDLRLEEEETVETVVSDLSPSLPTEDLPSEEDHSQVDTSSVDSEKDCEVAIREDASSLVEQLEEQVEEQREVLASIGDTLETIREDIDILQQVLESNNLGGVDEDMHASAAFLPLWFLVGAFVAGVGCMTLFSFAIYSLYQYWTSYPVRFIAWLERRVVTLFNDKQYAEVIAVLNKHLPEVKRLKGGNHIDTCAFKHYKARAYIALSEGKPALKLLQEVLNAYQPFGEDVYLAQVYEDIGISQHNLEEFEEALLNLQTALKIFTEEYSCESGDWKRKGSDVIASPDFDYSNSNNGQESSAKSEDSEPGLNFDYSTISSPEIVVVDGPFTPYTKYDEKGPATNPNFTDNIYPSDEHISQSLEGAFVSQVDLNTALKELEDLLADDPTPDNTTQPSSKVFKELQEVAHVDIARVCKEVGDVYLDIRNFQEALVFYQNALDILMKLLPKDAPQVESLSALVQSTQTQLLKAQHCRQLREAEEPHGKDLKSSPVSVAYFANYQTKFEEHFMAVK